MAGPRNILLALAIVSAIAASSENAAGEQEDHLDALELCLDPFPCRTSPHSAFEPAGQGSIIHYEYYVSSVRGASALP